MIHIANDLAKKKKYETKVNFITGNIKKINLPQTDIVILDKSLCCYPSTSKIIINSSKSCNEYYGFIIPRIDGYVNLISKIFCFFFKHCI